MKTQTIKSPFTKELKAALRRKIDIVEEAERFEGEEPRSWAHIDIDSWAANHELDPEVVWKYVRNLRPNRDPVKERRRKRAYTYRNSVRGTWRAARLMSRLGACGPAINWVQQCAAEGLTPQQCWDKCKRGYWMAWMLRGGGEPKNTPKFVQRCIQAVGPYIRRDDLVPEEQAIWDGIRAWRPGMEAPPRSGFITSGGYEHQAISALGRAIMYLVDHNSKESAAYDASVALVMYGPDSEACRRIRTAFPTVPDLREIARIPR